jgi:5'-3' exonuclease
MKYYYDADALVYVASWGDKTLEEALEKLDHSIEAVLSELWAHIDDVTFVVKGKGNFRHDIYSEYKSNRKSEEDPEKKAIMLAVYERLVNHYKAIKADGEEADDVVAYLAIANNGTVISPDKDLRTVPVPIYNPQKDIHYPIDIDGAHLMLHLQILTGDSTDGIPGIKGIGIKKAEKILMMVPASKRLATVKEAYRTLSNETDWIKYCQLMTDLIYIRQKPNERYNIVTGEKEILDV